MPAMTANEHRTPDLIWISPALALPGSAGADESRKA
jgi:hypothetical protein